MSITYPLTFPTIGIRRSAWRLQSIVAATQSEFTGQRYVYPYAGEWWEGEITFRPTSYSESAALKAFLASLNGKYGTFLYGDPDNIARGNRGAGGTILVNGAGQTGNTLVVDGGTPSATVLRAGDYFRLGAGSSARLHMVLQDCILDGSGAGTITFAPKLRESPADNATVHVTDRFGVFAMADNMAQWDSDFSSVAEITIPMREVL